MGFYNIILEGQQAEEYKARKAKEAEHWDRKEYEDDRKARERRDKREEGENGSSIDRMRAKAANVASSYAGSRMADRDEKQYDKTSSRIAQMSKKEFQSFAKAAGIDPNKKEFSKSEEERIQQAIHKDTNKSDPVISNWNHPRMRHDVDADAYETHLLKHRHESSLLESTVDQASEEYIHQMDKKDFANIAISVGVDPVNADESGMKKVISKIKNTIQKCIKKIHKESYGIFESAEFLNESGINFNDMMKMDFSQLMDLANKEMQGLQKDVEDLKKVDVSKIDSDFKKELLDLL